MAPEERKDATPLPESEDDTNLPDWLKGIEVEPSAETEDDLAWTADIDFSDLPGWLVPEASASVEEALFQEAEEEGKGLLAGVRGPIPIEPIILLEHKVPPFPGSVPRKSDSRAAPAPIFSGRVEVRTPPARPSPARTLLRAFTVVMLFVALILAAFTVVFLVLSIF